MTAQPIEKREKPMEISEARIKGKLAKRGVKILKNQDIGVFSSKGYGVSEKNELTLTFYEALYLIDRDMLEVKDKKREEMSLQELLKEYEKNEENAWARYLVYRDLRSRGYVVREGFGSGVDFRVYERGEYSKDAAKYLLMSIQEGKPVQLKALARALQQAQSLKKELVLAVMNRRGEVVYYSVSRLSLP